MANTAAERLKLKMSMGLIAKKFGDMVLKSNAFLTLYQAGDDRFDQMVKFMDSDAFDRNLALSGKPRTGCTVNAFTDFLYASVTTPPTIYINRSRYTPATCIHELLHFVTHPAFRAAFSRFSGIEEGITEHYTRKAQGVVNPATQGEFLSDRRGHYDEEVEAIQVIRTMKKSHLVPKGLLKQAYFLGNEESIQTLLTIVS